MHGPFFMFHIKKAKISLIYWTNGGFCGILYQNLYDWEVFL